MPDESELPLEFVMKVRNLKDKNQTLDPGYDNAGDEEAHFGAVLGSGRYKDF
jgi:hypothetical protein|eukprot:CAMPEP_0168314464 /NCGR_PEP_ID=MMETSP0210-20121227/8380_1 /TAXON_ID=40633 /ORGANISM="Condylostoma magnum, Strain COL2" /LENGTH=51 /DNA_ID=CAMNT_0008282873 /DNA_START=408 /DNA_END=563 /DNA_ORIENTATION=+